MSVLEDAAGRLSAIGNWRIAVLLFVSLACFLNGCASFTPGACNLTLGPIQAAVLHGNKCAYPGLVTLPDGSMLAAYACPQNLIQMSKSADGGVTWTPFPSVPFSGSADSMALLPDGTILLTTSSASPTGAGIPVYIRGTIQADGRINWSSAESVATPSWPDGCWAVSPVVSAGRERLLWPVWCFGHKTGGLPGSSTVLISTDSGHTWRRQVTVADGERDRRDYDESAAVVYPDGEIVLIIRSSSNSSIDFYGSYWESRSLDGGLTWTAPRKVAEATFVGRPSVVLLKSDVLVLVGRARTNPHSSTGYAVSRDRGKTFSPFADLGFDMRDTFDVYNATTVLPDGTVGVVTVHSNPGGLTTNVDYRQLVDACAIDREGSGGVPTDLEDQDRRVTFCAVGRRSTEPAHYVGAERVAVRKLQICKIRKSIGVDDRNLGRQVRSLERIAVSDAVREDSRFPR